MTRIEHDLRAPARRRRAPGLVTYVTAGDPDLARSAARSSRALDRGGRRRARGGRAVLRSARRRPRHPARHRARAGGRHDARPASSTWLAGAARQRSRAPIVLFTYANPMLRMGLGRLRATGRATRASTAC